MAAALFAVPCLATLPTPANADVLAPIWTGVYAGFHGGAKWTDIDTDNLGSFDTSAATGGGHLGFNVGLGAVIVGIEGELNYDGSDLDYVTSAGGNANLQTDWNSSLRARIGMPVGPALLYATAGFAWSEQTLHETSLTGASYSGSNTFTGVVYGIGAETYVLPNLSLRLEALRYDYGSEDISLQSAGGIAQDFDPSETVVRAGVSFHLN
ncbi:MAG: outer membrane protein [Hyphomicrobium sp.]